MRHRHSGRQLNRNSSHRKAMFRNMAASLIHHEAIQTTLPKAKELRRVAEPLITMAKTDSVAKRRLAFSRLRDRDAVTKLFNELEPDEGKRDAQIKALNNWYEKNKSKLSWDSTKGKMVVKK